MVLSSGFTIYGLNAPLLDWMPVLCFILGEGPHWTNLSGRPGPEGVPRLRPDMWVSDLELVDVEDYPLFLIILSPWDLYLC